MNLIKDSIDKIIFPITGIIQARIQDFEMGGEFL